ncbi:Mitochondrial inner membrane protein Mitofilin [Cinnamomum micranthum f. kanehirae]|uniref:Mitochondrial inner membrane protein Mitofilin n=1 Tax=Cinnamomum micranthum f. kanehirae TaxID=337451 RepID=A0A443N006_9MAGN|nr:Mitochondrial inner membrane protein Mitofilin [Cinnamomum micranthum f. kanehirae]
MSFEESMGAKVLAIWEALRTSKKRVHGNLIVKGGDPLNAFMMDEEDLKYLEDFVSRMRLDRPMGAADTLAKHGKQVPCFLSSRKEFSVSSQPNSSQGSTSSEKPSGSGNNISKFVLGSVAVGVAVMAAYQTGYIGHHQVKEDHSSFESSKSNTDDTNLKVGAHLEDEVATPNDNLNPLSPNVEDAVKTKEAHSDLPYPKDPLSNREEESPVEGKLEMTPAEEAFPVKETESSPPSSVAPDNQDGHSETSTEYNTLDKEKSEESILHSELSMKPNGEIDGTLFSEESVMEDASLHLPTSNDMPKDATADKVEPLSSLSDAYLLRERDDKSPEISLNAKSADSFQAFSEEKEVSGEREENLKDADVSNEEKIILDLIQAIHAAERRQADLDARIFSEEKRILKEKYEKEVKDARARELMYAEEAAILDKELNKEKVKTEATIRLLKEKAEENLKMELQQKEEQVQLELKKAQDLAKAELAAAIASEKSSQIEKMAEANLHIDALCMAFYARSEEARQSHSVHKLALFDALKGTLRHFSLIPSGGGGILAHTVAHIASSIKMRENNRSGDGIESVISKVESFLAEGKLAEAADALEGGVSGSQAEEIVVDWARQARNRAIMEQALSLLQSYATSISLT